MDYRKGPYQVSRCSICPAKYPIIEGHGPRPAKYFACGERPGRNELASGIPFVGDAGQEWDNTYLPRAGLSRSEVYVTNTVKCYAEQNRKPTSEEITVCANHHLPKELETAQSSVIFLMGSTACSLIPDIDLEVEHGIPRRGRLYGKDYWIVPHYHPALGLHETSKMIMMLEDWERLNERWAETADNNKPDYQMIEHSNDLDDYVPFDSIPLTAIDTESHQGQFYSIQFSWRTGGGRMILAENANMLDRWAKLQRSLMSRHPAKGAECKSLVFHYAPADLDITRQVLKMEFQYRDTMTECYELGNLPKGLKALGYRLCGAKMQDWTDLVTEPSKMKLLDWMTDRILAESERPIVEHKQLKTRLKTIEKPNGVESALRRIMRHTIESTTYDPWERLEALGLEGYPTKGIAHCRLRDVIQYGCRDADITLRVALKLDELRREFAREYEIQDEDTDTVGDGFALSPTLVQGRQAQQDYHPL